MFIRLIAIISCLYVLSPNSYANTPNSCEGHQCMAVVDVGSTGSRLHIFAYDLDTHQDPININELWNKKIKPGLATLDANQSTIDTYLNNLFIDAPASNMPVYFYATAGMRLLSVQKQALYYQSVQNWFALHGQWQLKAVKTITGKEEALYDWLAVNYQLGTLKSDVTPTIGVMDMGGASVQIVFPTKTNATAGDNSHVALDIYGKHYDLSVNSYLGLGQTESSHHFLNSLACFSNNYPLPDGNLGQGNAQTCAAEVANLVNNVHAVNKTMQPLLADVAIDSWYVIGGLASLAATKPMQFENQQLTLKQVLEQAENKLCKAQWDQLSSEYPNDEYIYMNCLSSAYYYALVVQGYGIKEDQYLHYEPNADWTKGVVLYHS